MKCLVVGSGLIGLTTAYFLKRAGHDVTVVDREAAAGRGCSFANGALLTPSMSEPWNAPGSWRVLLASLGRSDAAMQMRLRALPGLASWGVKFLRNSSVATFERNALSNLRLGLYSLEVMATLREQTKVEYGRYARGTLRIFRTDASLDQAHAVALRREREGLRFRRLYVAELVELEPALQPIGDQLSGGLHYPIDETGDAYRFCTGLADHAARQGVEFRFSTEVLSLETRLGRVVGAVGSHGRFVADQYIVAAGSYSSPLLRGAGIALPVQPVKGYSITLDRTSGLNMLAIPIIDDQLHAAIVPLEGALRAAGTAEFAGYDLDLNKDRVSNLLRLLRAVLPREEFNPLAAKPWCGLRPMSADGVPIIGPTAISNLWINSGHGPLGWTLAAGSAKLLADSICGDSPAIDPTPFALARFA